MEIAWCPTKLEASGKIDTWGNCEPDCQPGKLNENITEEKDKCQSKQTTKVKKVIRKKIIKEGDKKQLAPKEARVSKRVSRKPKHDGFVENYTSDEEVLINVKNQRKNPAYGRH